MAFSCSFWLLNEKGCWVDGMTGEMRTLQAAKWTGLSRETFGFDRIDAVQPTSFVESVPTYKEPFDKAAVVV